MPAMRSRMSVPSTLPNAVDSVPCKVYNRYRLKSGDRITGPAIVEEVDSTIVLHPDYRADVDLHGNILIQETAV